MTRQNESRNSTPETAAPQPASSTAQPASDTPEAEAKARLHQLREEAGGALSGRELARRFGLQDDPESGDPPLDWRLTPRNVILQLLGAVVFGAVVWFLASLFFGGVASIFNGAG